MSLQRLCYIGRCIRNSGVLNPNFLTTSSSCGSVFNGRHFYYTWTPHTMQSENSTFSSCSPVFNNGGNFNNYVSKRFYNRKNVIKIPPTKLLSFDYSGDQTNMLPPLDRMEPKPEFADVADLINKSNDEVKKIFSVEFSDGTEKLKKRIMNIIEVVKDHPADVRSLEYLVALQTVLIRNQMKHCLDFRKDKVAKSRLIERIQGRRKKLKFLRRLDYQKFEWLCNELKLKFVHIPLHRKKLSKRALRKKAAREAAIKLRNDKLAVFRSKVEQERKLFDDYKENELDDISDQMKSLGLEMGDTLDSALLALGETPYSPPKLQKRRRLLLAMKFELYKDNPPRGKKAAAQ